MPPIYGKRRFISEVISRLKGPFSFYKITRLLNKQYDVEEAGRDKETLIKFIKTDKAVILSTHILEEAEVLCDRVVILTNGKIFIGDKIE